MFFPGFPWKLSLTRGLMAMLYWEENPRVTRVRKCGREQWGANARRCVSMLTTASQRAAKRAIPSAVHLLAHVWHCLVRTTWQNPASKIPSGEEVSWYLSDSSPSSSASRGVTVCFMGVDSAILKNFYHLVPLAALEKPDPSACDMCFWLLSLEIVGGTRTLEMLFVWPQI